ncbi:MAG TPA: malonyl CoA-acyl carrier protein transacylase, partial [Candidatus Eisenbacteria bacterium]
PVVAGDEIRVSLERQLLGAVRWEESMRWLTANAGMHMVEIGPGRVLKGLMRSIDRAASVANVEDPEGVAAFMAPEGDSK